MKSTACGLSFLLTFIFSTSVRAASIGDPAPPLFVEHWVKGSPVRIGPGTNVFVVDFWATWCPPCRKSIPELTAMQRKFADQGVIFIGISEEKISTVEAFVATQGAGMDYRVAVDTSSRSMKNWHTAFGATGIPHAFIVGTNGLVIWHDFPNAKLERALEQVLNGTFNIDRAGNFETGDRYVKQYAVLARKPNSISQTAPIGEKILAEYSQDRRIPIQLAQVILTDPKVRARDLPLAMRAATMAVEMSKRQSSDALQMLARAQFATGSKSEALATAQESLSICKNASDIKDLREMIALYEKASKTANVPKK